MTLVQISHGMSLQVVDTTAVREYKVPGASHKSSALELLGQMFLTGHRLLAREVQQRRRRGKQAVARAYELPRFSEHVLSIVLDFVGCVVDEDGAQTVVGNSQLHFRRCWEVLGVNASVRCASYGWHAQQLTAAEYCAFVNREASANLDLMTEARGRPRPAHAEKAAADGEVDLGLEAEFVDLGDEAVVSDIDVDELPVKPDLQYQPRLHVPQGEVLEAAHRLNVKSSGPGRASASAKRSLEFVKQYAEKYKELQEPRSCVRQAEAGAASCSAQQVHHGLQKQKALQEIRKEVELGNVEDMDDEVDEHVRKRIVEAGVAPSAEVLTLSPAEKALQLVQQRLPVAQRVPRKEAAVSGGSVPQEQKEAVISVDAAGGAVPAPVVAAGGAVPASVVEAGGAVPAKMASAPGAATAIEYAISPDQYNAVILAISPLQRLWKKANEAGVSHRFGDPTRVMSLLELVEKAAWFVGVGVSFLVTNYFFRV